MSQRKPRQIFSPHPPMEVEDRLRRLLTQEKLKMVGGIAGEIRNGQCRFWVKNISDFLSIHVVATFMATGQGTNLALGFEGQKKFLTAVLIMAVGFDGLGIYFLLNPEQFSSMHYMASFFLGSFLPVLLILAVIKANSPLLRFFKDLAAALDAPLPRTGVRD